jgi:nucleotidyltransferase substrate binding protein (TIGR01987 family)
LEWVCYWFILQTDTLQITSEILSLIAQIDEVKGAWRTLGMLAPDRLSALRRIATIESIGSSTRIDGNNTLTNDDLDTVKAGVIQNFEVAYEQCWKFMKRWIEQNVNSDAVDGISRRELFRVCAEERLIDDVQLWMAFHQSRNLTSHTYDADNAEEAFVSALKFGEAAQDVLKRLEARND